MASHMVEPTPSFALSSSWSWCDAMQVQQVGRAGRNGEAAMALLFLNDDDLRKCVLCLVRAA